MIPLAKPSLRIEEPNKNMCKLSAQKPHRGLSLRDTGCNSQLVFISLGRLSELVFIRVRVLVAHRQGHGLLMREAQIVQDLPGDRRVLGAGVELRHCQGMATVSPRCHGSHSLEEVFLQKWLFKRVRETLLNLLLSALQSLIVTVPRLARKRWSV